MQVFGPIVGWKLLLVGGFGLMLAALCIWLIRDDAAWERLWAESRPWLSRRSALVGAWAFSVLSVYLVFGGINGDETAADIGGCCWWLMIGAMTAFIMEGLLRVFRSST